MILAFQIIGMLGFFAAAAGGLFIVFAAFRQSFFRGLLVIFLPFYIVLYALFSYEGKGRLLVQFLFFGGIVLGVSMFMLAQNADPGAPIFR